MEKMLKNITFSADRRLIKLAREKAKKENSSLNEKFRKWLESYTNSGKKGKDYLELMDSLSYFKIDSKFTREEMNER